MFNGFCFAVRKDTADMTIEELYRELDSAHSYFDECIALEQGIGSKETVRMRNVSAELVNHAQTEGWEVLTR